MSTSIARPSGVYNESYNQELAIIRTPFQWAILILGLVWLFTLPLYAGGYALTLINSIGIILITMHGLNILTGYCGLISVGQSAFMMVGAYTLAILEIHAKFSFWVALPCAVLVSGIVGLIFGLPSIRVKGFYLTMATLAAQFIIPWAFGHVATNITGGPRGVSVPPVSFMDQPLLSQTGMFFLIMPFALGATYFAKNLVRTRVGRAFVAIRDNDLAAELMGIDVTRYKLLAFFICSLFAGLAGALWASWMRGLNPESFNMMNSVWYLGMLVVGGMGSTTGAFFGAMLVVLLNEGTKVVAPILTTAIGIQSAGLGMALGPILLGLIILIFLIFEPRGLAHSWQLFKTYYRLWPFSH